MNDAPTQRDPTISVVICAYADERWHDLVAAAESSRRQTLDPLETIVVVDYNERLLARVRSELPEVIGISNVESRGLAGARNSGLAVARAEVVAFLDDDAAAEDEWLEHLVAHYRDGRVVGVGGLIEPVWPSVRPSHLPRELDWVVGCSYRGLPERLSPVRNLIGANMSFRRAALVEVGAFENGIGRIGTRPVGCEETDLCIRVKQRWPDSVLLYDPAARVRHRVTADRTSWAYLRSRCYAEGLSKAIVSSRVGASDGLETERRYVTRTLPRAIIGGLGGLPRGDTRGLVPAAAIIVAAAAACAGYVVGRARFALSGGQSHTRAQGASAG